VFIRQKKNLQIKNDEIIMKWRFWGDK